MRQERHPCECPGHWAISVPASGICFPQSAPNSNRVADGGETHFFFTALHFWNNPEDHRLEWATLWLMLHPVQKFLLKRQSAGLAPGIRSGTGRGTLTLHCSATVHFPIVFQLWLPLEKRKENTCHCKAQQLQPRPRSACWRVKITGTKFLLLKVKGRSR